ncbi:PREDICTED: retinoic acid-induced protein 1-like [Cyprinodon variegatus]|uniref:retinoic acid-induced protein 1-like n=1 Tax=Cyprinodon variegatus TaxID=28743 RepID=UPI0007426F0B|nr:PREDICTED: retinoic acid-induced protein 1-like [Cyprinodon variegatus]
MEQPPGSLEDLQHQGISSSIIPGVTDLSRKEEECLLASPSLDAFRRVKGSGWAPSPRSAIPGLQFSDTGSSDVPLRSGDQIQPDNALSHTTVTLSYVSSSHVFSTLNSSLCSVSPVSRFSFHPQCNTDDRLGESSYAVNQQYLGQEEEPVNLVTQAEPFCSQPQVASEEDARENHVREPPEINGGVISSDGKPLENAKCLENGRGDHWSSSGASSESSSEVPQVEDRKTADVFFVEAEKQDNMVSDAKVATDLCSVSREYRSPLEDPVSPPSTSADDVEDVFLLPLASSSPSAEAFCPDAADDEATQQSSAVSDCPSASDPRDESKQSPHGQKVQPLLDDPFVSAELEKNAASVVPHINGEANVLEKTLKERKLPMRSGRGTRLEAIVMNINSSRYKVSGCIRAGKKPRASQTAAKDTAFPGSQRTLPGCRRRGKAKASLSLRTVKRKAVKVKGEPRKVDAGSCNDSTSVSGLINSTEASGGSPPAKRPRFVRPNRKPLRSRRRSPATSEPLSQSDSPFPAHKSLKKRPVSLPALGPSVDVKASKVPPPRSPQKSSKDSQSDGKRKSSGRKSSPTKKTKATKSPKRRRKKAKCSQPSAMFSPKEPEIKLRYVNYKEDRKELRSQSFSPFVRVSRQPSSHALCTIMNYPEEVKADAKPQQQQAQSSRFVSAVVPSTSCLQLGRPSKHGQHQRALVCCLCGQSANSIDLGDLHGPYYPEGYRPNTKTPASGSVLKEDEDDSSDSDSSSSGMRARRWACSPGAQLKQKGLLGNRRWAGGRTRSPAAKRARPDAGAADVEDWYSPPVLPVEPCEYWIHEDCGVWSAGVFLVKGKVYGLEEAVKVAQETMCSACHHPGATLGCFFKGCPNKYHYRCALESDCVLIEENFSMKCRKHKNKTLKASPGRRRDDR